MMNTIIVDCPNCDGTIIITKMNCKIFRHGIYKKTGKQVGPHAKDEFVQQLISKDRIYGCGCQFRMVDGKPVLI